MTRNYLDILAETIRNNWDSPALTDFYLTEDGKAQDTSRGNHYTYGEMYCEMMRLCELFRAIGLKRGNHIAICGSNSANWAVAYLAIAAYQGVAVTVLHSQSTEDIAHQIDFSDAVALFTDRKLWQELKPVHPLSTLTHVIALDDYLMLQGQLLTPYQFTGAKQKEYQKDNITISLDHNLDDLAMICFTSGSTGVSKGVMLQNKACENGISASRDMLPDSYNKQYLSILPFSHISGLFVDIIDQLLGGHHIYINNNILLINKIISLIHPYTLTVVPAILERLIADNLSSLKCMDIQQINIGGAKMSLQLLKVLKEAQIPHIVLYASTEGLLISYGNKRFSCGTVCKGVNVAISDENEILVKGENVMLGYYKDPEATARKIDKDGWLHTGDRGHLDEDGYLYVEGRMEQDMIVLPNGENIHPEDIESKLNAMPEVHESLVLARDGRLVAIVVPQYTLHPTPYTLHSTPYTLHPTSYTDAAALRRDILRTINPQLPLYSQLYDVEITDIPLQRTEKQTIKRYLYS